MHSLCNFLHTEAIILKFIISELDETYTTVAYY